MAIMAFMFVSENSCSKNFINFQEKHFCECCRLPDTYWECSPGKFSFHKKQLQMAASAISCY